MSVADRISEAIERGVREFGEKVEGIARHIEERAPELSRGIAMLTTASLVASIPVIALATSFPTVALMAPYVLTFVTFLIQLGLAVMIVSLVIGVARRII